MNSSMKVNSLSSIRKIAVLRANALGDFIFALPALSALKKRFPDAELVYLGKQWHKEFLEGRNNVVNRVEVIPGSNGIFLHKNSESENKKVEDFFGKMRAEEFDLAFQLHGGGKYSNPFVKKLGAKLSIGLKTPDADALDINYPYYLYHQEILRYAEVVSSVGAVVNDLIPSLRVTDKDMAELFTSYASLKYPFAVIHPGASEVKRMWSPEKFGEVAKVLHREGLHVYITGSPAEVGIGDKVVSCSDGVAENLAGKLSLKALTGLFSLAKLVVSNDTGPLHLARALKIPTVGLFWSGNLLTAGVCSIERDRVCISWRTTCPLCNSNFAEEKIKNSDCSHQASIIDDITLDEVVGQVNSLIKMESLSDKHFNFKIG